MGRAIRFSGVSPFRPVARFALVAAQRKGYFPLRSWRLNARGRHRHGRGCAGLRSHVGAGLDGFLLTGCVHPFRAVREEGAITLRALLERWGAADGRRWRWRRRDIDATSTAVRLALLAGRLGIGLLG